MLKVLEGNFQRYNRPLCQGLDFRAENQEKRRQLAAARKNTKQDMMPPPPGSIIDFVQDLDLQLTDVSPTSQGSRLPDMR